MPLLILPVLFRALWFLAKDTQSINCGLINSVRFSNFFILISSRVRSRYTILNTNALIYGSLAFFQNGMMNLSKSTYRRRKRRMSSILFFCVSFFASIAGAICGIGGGVIIKAGAGYAGPCQRGNHQLSGCTVLSMSCYTVGKNHCRWR